MVSELLQLRLLLPQPLVDFTPGTPLFPLGRVHVMARQAPEAAQQGPIVGTTSSGAVHKRFGRNASLTDWIADVLAVCGVLGAGAARQHIRKARANRQPEVQ